jgi:hypothetical protein
MFHCSPAGSCSVVQALLCFTRSVGIPVVASGVADRVSLSRMSLRVLYLKVVEMTLKTQTC